LNFTFLIVSLLEFYGDACPHCVKMDGLVKQLEKEEGVSLERFEIWNNEENSAKMSELDKGLCGGVPFFYNTETKAYICGEASYDDLKAWAKNHTHQASH